MTEQKTIDLAYLPLLVEEAGEVIQAAMKIQRFGPECRYLKGEHKGRTNVEALAVEIGDFLEILERLGLPQGFVEVGIQKKKDRLRVYGPHVWSQSKAEAFERGNWRESCGVFEPGEPSGDCQGDGHFMCNECKNRSKSHEIEI